MFATLLELTEGVALTANQVGISKRMFVARLPHQKEIESISLTATPEYEEFTESFVCINPKIVAKDYNFLYSFNEGCLSIPGYYKKNSRFGSIVLEYQNSLGGRLTTQFQGFAAFAVQHEIDHLDGKLFIDGYSKLKLDLIKRVVKKKHRALSRAVTAVFF
jgi:peptide deformylase